MKEVLKTTLKLLLGRGSMRSYSQFGEDAVLGALFRKQKSGFYVDIGCYHPILYSNTYALYTKGWRGLAIDPNKQMENLFRLFRPRDSFVCAAIGEKMGTGTYYAYRDPAYNSLSRERVEELSNIHGMQSTHQYDIPIEPLQDIFKSQGVTRIDFLTIDIEGFDFEVLRGYDWSIRPKVIAVEDHHFDAFVPTESPLVAFLKDKNYRLSAYTGVTLIFRDEM